MATVYQAKTGEQFTVTDEKPIGGFSQFGIVYAAQDSAGAGYVVKVSRNPDFNPRFIAEYDTLVQVASATGAKYNGETYTPFPVFLVSEEGSDLQAVAMPRYKNTLAAVLSDSYRKDEIVNAELWLLHGATTYLKVLDSIHATQQTCADRKQDDFFVTENQRVITIDWNVLQPYTPEARVTEVKITVRRWVELTSQRNAREGDFATVFKDEEWTRPDTGEMGKLGAVSVGLRWIFAQALDSKDPEHFRVLREQIRHWRGCLEGTETPTRHTLVVSNDAVFSAIEADLAVRLKQGNPTERSEALAAALAYPVSFKVEVINALDTARKQLMGGDSAAARVALDSVPATHLEEQAAVQRWKLGLEILAASEMRDRATNRQKVVNVVTRLIRGWQEDPASIAALNEVVAQLDDLAKRTVGVEDKINTLKSEAEFRLNYLAVLGEKDPTARYEKLKGLGDGLTAVEFYLPGFREELTRVLSSEVGAGTPSRVIDAVKQVETAYQRLLAALKQLQIWDDVYIVGAIRQFDRDVEVARTVVLLRTPDYHGKFNDDVMPYLSVRDALDYLRFEHEKPVTDTFLEHRLPKSDRLMALARKSPAFLRPVLTAYNHFQANISDVHKTITTAKTEAISALDVAKDKMVEDAAKIVKTTKDAIDSEKNTALEVLKKSGEDILPKKPSKRSEMLPLGVAIAALLVAFLGVLTGLGGPSAIDVNAQATQSAQILVAALSPSDQTSTADAIIVLETTFTLTPTPTETDIPTETPVPPTETPSPTHTPTPVEAKLTLLGPVNFATENYYALTDNTVTLTVQVRGLDGLTPFSEAQSVTLTVTKPDGTVESLSTNSTNDLGNVIFIMQFLDAGTYSLKFNLNQSAHVLPQEIIYPLHVFAPLEYVVTPAVGTVPEATSTTLRVNPDTDTWLDAGLLMALDSGLPESAIIGFDGVAAGYPIGYRYSTLVGESGLLIHEFNTSERPDGVVMLVQNEGVLTPLFRITAASPGLHKLELVDPLRGQQVIDTLVFAVGFERAEIPVITSNPISVTDTVVMGFENANRRDTQCKSETVDMLETVMVIQPATLDVTGQYLVVAAIDQRQDTVQINQDAQTVNLVVRSTSITKIAPPAIDGKQCIAGFLDTVGVSGPIQLKRTDGTAEDVIIPAFFANRTFRQNFPTVYFVAKVPQIAPSAVETPVPTLTSAPPIITITLTP